MEPRDPWTPPAAPSGSADDVVAADPVVPAAPVVPTEPVAPVAAVVPPEPASPPVALDPSPASAPEGPPALDLDAVTADLAGVEAALERLDQGSYGRCGSCGSGIEDDLLASDPTATTCAAHLPV